MRKAQWYSVLHGPMGMDLSRFPRNLKFYHTMVLMSCHQDIDYGQIMTKLILRKLQVSLRFAPRVWVKIWK